MKSVLNIGVVIADGMEYKPFLEYSRNIRGYSPGELHGNECVSFPVSENGKKIDVTIVKCGIGKVNASSAASFLIAGGTDIIINTGLSGGISKVRRGDIIIGSSYMEADFDLTPLGFQLGRKPDQEYIYKPDERLCRLFLQLFPSIKTGKFGTGDFFLTSSEKKLIYKNKFDLAAFDMESGAVASVCYKSFVPFISIRKVSDDASEEAPNDYGEMNNKAESDLLRVLTGGLSAIIKTRDFWEQP